MKKFISLIATSVVILGIGFVGVSLYGKSHAQLDQDKASRHEQINEVIIYSTPDCRFCTLAKDILNEYNINFTEKKLRDRNSSSGEFALNQQEFMQKLPGVRSVPQIFIGREHIGGYSELRDLVDSNQLMKKVTQPQ